MKVLNLDTGQAGGRAWGRYRRIAADAGAWKADRINLLLEQQEKVT